MFKKKSIYLKKNPGCKFSLPVTLICFYTLELVAITLKMEIFTFKPTLKDELCPLCALVD